MKRKVFIYLASALLTVLPFTSCSDSDNPVNPPESKIRVISPDGGEVWNRGGQRTIIWENELEGSVSIELLKAGELYTLLADTVEADSALGIRGEYLWTVPTEIPVSGDYSVRITSLDDPDETDESDGNFRTGWPLLSIYDPPSEITDSEFRVQWYGNSNDSTDLTYYFCVTTDTLIADGDALSTLSSGLWRSTVENYAAVSFPVSALNSTVIYSDTTTYTSGELSIPVRVVFSRFFVYAKDAYGAVSPVVSKVFGRMNTPPKYPMVYSNKLKVNGTEKYWMTVGGDSAVMILSKQTAAWNPIDFSWRGEDPDGIDVKLEFKWELWERERITGTDNMIALAASSDGWSGDYTTVSFAQEIWDHNNNAEYAFKVFVRDDALEQSELNATVNFEVFPPTFDKGILFINDTDSLLSSSSSYQYFQGNPDGQAASDFYRQLLENSGFTGSDPDPIRRVTFERFTVEYDTAWTYTPTVVGEDTIITVDSTITNFYSPNIRKLSEYRLVIIASDDRNNQRGVDFNGNADNIGYSNYLAGYLDVGGKVFLVGSSVMMKIYPYNMECNDYIEPVIQIFDPYAPIMTQVSNLTKTFFRDYFGIYSMTFPETKTWFCQAFWDLGVPGQSNTPIDYYLRDNYDFIGVSPYEHISESEFVELRVDSSIVNDCWLNYIQQLGPFQLLMTMSLKDNGTVFTGVPTIETFKGESVYQYKSIYDLPTTPEDDDIVYDTDQYGTIYHSLEYTDPVLTDGDNSGYITRRSGAVATRYISESSAYRTAFFTFPLYFMDDRDKNTDGVGDMTGMFKSMIEWFDLSVDPADNWKKK